MFNKEPKTKVCFAIVLISRNVYWETAVDPENWVENC